MITGFEKIVEQRIQDALRKGEFDNLYGSGKPLVFENDSNVSEELRLAYKILKNADYLPPEVELKKQINQTKELLSGMKETSDKYCLIKKLNFLIMKLNSIRNTPVMYEMPQQYEAKLIGRFGSKPAK
ncbi:MAG: DnaJ family domain-containing protein [Thermodesulfobacteriota bacterium]|nr:DnaJ family domain-containing protein [Thermodesulfobacteriota bacterium]